MTPSEASEGGSRQAEPPARDSGPAAPSAAAVDDASAVIPSGDTAHDDGAGPDARPDAADLAEQQREAARRRRRIDEVFGDVLPKTTSDEREPGHRRGFSLEHYRQSRPPHWGDKQ